MKLPVNLAGASREELIEIIGQLISLIEAQEARIAELEGQQKPLDAGLKERKPPSWAKANRPARSKKERKKRIHRFVRRREEPTHRVEHATASCPGCRVPLAGGRVRRRRQIITIPRVRAEYNQLQQEIRASPVVYGDETGWREDGRNGYLWSFSNPEVRCFLRRASRGKASGCGGVGG